jgi:hypothetical protein
MVSSVAGPPEWRTKAREKSIQPKIAEQLGRNFPPCSNGHASLSDEPEIKI